MSKYLQESYDALMLENIKTIEQNKRLLAEVERLRGALEKVYEMDGYMFVKEALEEPTPE